MNYKNLNLFLDTTQKICYIGLYENEKLIGKIVKETNNNLTDVVIELIKQLLNELKIKKENIKDIYITKGPGSFTGDKIGILIGRCWKSINSSVKLHTFSSLALQLPCANGVSLIDAKSEKTYICVYKENKKIVEEKIIKNSQINSYLNKFKSLKIYKNYEGINIFKNFIFWKQHYSDKHINPMYIKKII